MFPWIHFTEPFSLRTPSMGYFNFNWHKTITLFAYFCRSKTFTGFTDIISFLCYFFFGDERCHIDFRSTKSYYKTGCIFSQITSLSFLNCCVHPRIWYRQKESNLYSHVRSVVYYPLYYSDKIGALTPIRTEKTAPFERADFTNLSIRALAGPAGVEPTTSVSKTEMISISPRTDKNGEPNYPPGRTRWIVSNDQV